MQVILLENIHHLGNLGDVVKVKDGYGRNYLIPQGHAKRATKAAIAEFETRRAELRTYENNLGFLNAKSNSGNSLVQSFQQKIERLRADIATLEDKIRDLDKEA